MNDVEQMKEAWGSKHALITDIVHTIKAIARGQHSTSCCRFCYRTGHLAGCLSCPIAVFLNSRCWCFKVFFKFGTHNNRDPVTITAIINKLVRMVYKVAQIEDW